MKEKAVKAQTVFQPFFFVMNSKRNIDIIIKNKMKEEKEYDFACLYHRT